MIGKVGSSLLVIIHKIGGRYKPSWSVGFLDFLDFLMGGAPNFVLIPMLYSSLNLLRKSWFLRA